MDIPPVSSRSAFVPPAPAPVPGASRPEGVLDAVEGIIATIQRRERVDGEQR